jgi:hypothetical protein
MMSMKKIPKPEINEEITSWIKELNKSLKERIQEL